MNNSDQLDTTGLSRESLAVLAARDAAISSGKRRDRAQLLRDASMLLAAIAKQRGKQPRDDIWLWPDEEAAATLLLGRTVEARDEIERTFHHRCDSREGGSLAGFDGSFAELDAKHIERCDGLVRSLAVIRLMTADWTPLPEAALRWTLGESGAFDRDSELRRKANVLMAFATRDAGRARRALSQMERAGDWAFDEAGRFDLLAGALYAEGAKLGFVELPDRYQAFGESATARAGQRGRGS